MAAAPSAITHSTGIFVLNLAAAVVKPTSRASPLSLSIASVDPSCCPRAHHSSQRRRFRRAQPCPRLALPASPLPPQRARTVAVLPAQAGPPLYVAGVAPMSAAVPVLCRCSRRSTHAIAATAAAHHHCRSDSCLLFSVLER